MQGALALAASAAASQASIGLPTAMDIAQGIADQENAFCVSLVDACITGDPALDQPAYPSPENVRNLICKKTGAFGATCKYETAGTSSARCSAKMRYYSDIHEWRVASKGSGMRPVKYSIKCKQAA